MISIRWLSFGACVALLALIGPLLAQDPPVIAAENAAALLYKTTLSSLSTEQVKTLTAIPNSTKFFYKHNEVSTSISDTPRIAAPHDYTVLDYANDTASVLDGFWTLSPDGRVWITYAQYPTANPYRPEMELIDVATQSVVSTLPTDGFIDPWTIFKFSPTSRFVQVIGGTDILWDTGVGLEIVLPPQAQALRFNHDDTLMINVSDRTDEIVVDVWDIATGAPLRTFRELDYKDLNPYVPDPALVSPQDNLLIINALIGPALWNVETGEELPLPRFSNKTANHLALFSGTGKTVILQTYSYTTNEMTLTFWDIETQSVIAMQSVAATQDDNAVLNNTATHIMVYGTEQTVVIDAETGKRVLDLPSPAPTGLTFSPDSRLLVTWHENLFTLWSLESGETVAAFASRSGDAIGEIRFSADGTTLLIQPESGSPELWTIGV